MRSSTPTLREIFLLACLFFFLVTFPTSYKTPSLSEITKLRTNQYLGDESEDALVTFESKFSLQTLNVPLKWGQGQVPKTDIVVHVPGMSCRLYLDYS
jgi:hypothetical protein